MDWKPIKSKEEIIADFKKHMDLYASKYGEGIREELNDYFIDSIGNTQIYSEFSQIYDDIGAIAPCTNHYIAYLDMLMKQFNINCNILEVGGGCIPTFARYVSAEQMKTGVGTITVYDSRLISRKKYGCKTMHLHKQDITSKTNISAYDLVVGIMPCLGTDDTLELIKKYKKDFFLALCGCDHDAFKFGYYPYGYYRASYNDYIPYAEKICCENGLGELCVDYLPDRFEIPYPVIYNKRKQG